MAQLTPLQQRPHTAVTPRRPGELIIPNRPQAAEPVGPYALTVGFDGVAAYGFDVNAGYGDLAPRASFVPGYQYIQVRATIAVGTDSVFIVFATDADPLTSALPPGVTQVALVYDGGTISPPFPIFGSGFTLFDDTVGEWFQANNGTIQGIDIIDAT